MLFYFFVFVFFLSGFTIQDRASEIMLLMVELSSILTSVMLFFRTYFLFSEYVGGNDVSSCYRPDLRMKPVSAFGR